MVYSEGAYKKFNRLVVAMNELHLASRNRQDIKYDLAPAIDAIEKACVRLKKEWYDEDKVKN